MPSGRGALRRIGRWLKPLLDPDGDDRAQREADLAKRVGQIGKASSDLTEDVARLSRRVEAFDRAWPADLRKAIDELRQLTRRQSAVGDRLVRSASARGEREAVRERVMRRLQHLARRDGPIIVGPWTGEVGFELLYWAPFVRFVVRKYRIHPERLTIVSRGGTAAWYGIAGAKYVDALSLVRPEEFRTRTAEDKKKQRVMRSFDRDLVRRVRTRIGGTGASLLHPALMYSLFMPYWKQQEAISTVIEAADFRKVAAAAPPGLSQRLPADYVAVRLYFSDCFPDTPANRQLASGIVASLAAQGPVVVLGPGVRLDDHEDWTPAVSREVVTLDDLMQPDTNLEVQTAAIAGARALVSTYGGFSYLGPLCGVPTIALYSERNYFAYHLEFARMLFDAVGADPFTALPVDSLPLLQQISAIRLAPRVADHA